MYKDSLGYDGSVIRFHKFSFIVTQKEILRDISLELNLGKKIVITGPSGSGKSSFIKALLGLLPTWRGDLNISGTEMSAETISDIRKLYSYIPQEFVSSQKYVYEYLVRDVMNLDGDKINTEAKVLFKDLILEESIIHSKLEDISGGEKRRLMILNALIMKRPIMIADEFTSNLDEVSKTKTINLMLKENSVISVSHDEDWIHCCDLVYELDHGILKEKKL